MDFPVLFHLLYNVSSILILFFIVSSNVIVDGKSRHDSSSRSSSSSTKRSNIILLITDDQDVELGSMEYMPKTLKIMRENGAEFWNGFVTTPLCCPSRSTILTGMYVHNHHVHSNNENCTGHWWSDLHEPRSVGAYLQKSGYRTGYFGKYLNEYNGSYIPVGWDEWMGLVKNSRFYNYTINFNGVRIRHGDSYKFDYFTDLVANDTLTFLRQSLLHHRDEPVFAVVSFPAPHGPEDPAPHYSNIFANVTTHRTPSWNYAPNPDKQWLLQHTGKMEPVHVAFTDFLHQRRLQTLLSVDDAVHRIYEELKESGELANTYLIFTSDHGYHLGQFGLIKGKMMPYEFDLKVPYFVRGPGIGRGLRLWQPVANIDVMPTILDMAGVQIPDHVDGRSILDVIKYEAAANINSKRGAGRHFKPQPWRHTLLIERGLRPKLLRLRERLERQKERYSKDIRIQNECDQPLYRAPCKPAQQWECRRNEIGRWRIFKCRGRIISSGGGPEECTCPPPTPNYDKKNGTAAGEDRTPFTAKAKRRRHRARRALPLPLPLSEEEEEDHQQGLEPLSLSEWESIADDDDVAHVSQEQLEMWEEEFFLTVIQERDNDTSLDENWECHGHPSCEDDDIRYKRSSTINATTGSSTNSKNGKRKQKHRLRQQQHSTSGTSTKLQKKTEQLRVDDGGTTKVQGCALYSNHTVHCQPEVYTNYQNWLQHKYKVDDRIRILRNRLQDLKGVRRHLKAGKPLELQEQEQQQLLPKDASFWDSSSLTAGVTLSEADNKEPEERTSSGRCRCSGADVGDAGSHPLRRSSQSSKLSSISSVGTLSDAELLAYAEERRRQRAQKKKEKADNNSTSSSNRGRQRGGRGGNRRRNNGGDGALSSAALAKTFCNVPNLNCFTHDNSHWKTPPYWTLGPFCFCQNSNNNTYWCLRTVNSTHNFLYCEFVTGFISFYDIGKDRYQLSNSIYDLSIGVIEQLSAQLEKLRNCRGAKECEKYGTHQ